MLGDLLKKIAPALAGPLLVQGRRYGGDRSQVRGDADDTAGARGADRRHGRLARGRRAGHPGAAPRASGQAGQRFEVEMGKLGVEVTRIHAEDRSDARQREIKTGGGWVMDFLACWSLMTFTACCGTVIWLETHPESSWSGSPCASARSAGTTSVIAYSSRRRRKGDGGASEDWRGAPATRTHWRPHVEHPRGRSMRLALQECGTCASRSR